MWVGAVFGACAVVGLGGALVGSEMCTFTLGSAHFVFGGVPFALAAVRVPGLALTRAGRIAV